MGIKIVSPPIDWQCGRRKVIAKLLAVHGKIFKSGKMRLQQLASTFGGWDQPGCGWHLGVATGSWSSRTTFQLASQDKYLEKLFFQIFSFSLSLYKDVNWKESFQVKKKKQSNLWVKQGQLLMRSVHPCLCDWQTDKENYLNYFKILDHIVHPFLGRKKRSTCWV